MRVLLCVDSLLLKKKTAQEKTNNLTRYCLKAPKITGGQNGYSSISLAAAHNFQCCCVLKGKRRLDGNNYHLGALQRTPCSSSSDSVPSARQAHVVFELPHYSCNFLIKLFFFRRCFGYIDFFSQIFLVKVWCSS